MLTAESFKKALEFVQHVINPEHQLPGFRGVVFDFEGDSMFLVATDGTRMAVAQCLVPPSDLKGPYIIAPDQLKHLVFPGMGWDAVKFSHAHGARAIMVAYGDAQAYATVRIMPAETQWPRWRETINQKGWNPDREKGYAGPYLAAACIAITKQFGPTIGIETQGGPLIVRALELPKPEVTPGVILAMVATAPRLVTREPV